MESKLISRGKALEELEKFGIKGNDVYFIDIIPLIEMIWADGQAQDGEMAIFNEFLQKHVKHLNKLAGFEAFTVNDARKFVARFFKKRPSPNLLKTLRQLSICVGTSCADPGENAAHKESLLGVCLDIAASSTTQLPYGLHDRFEPSEKRCFFEILDTLEGKRK